MEVMKTEKHTVEIPEIPGFRFIGIKKPKQGQYYLNYLEDRNLSQATFDFSNTYSFVYEKELEKSDLIWHKIKDFPTNREGVYLLSNKAINNDFDQTLVIRIFADFSVLDIHEERVLRDPLGNFEFFAILE